MTGFEMAAIAVLAVCWAWFVFRYLAIDEAEIHARAMRELDEDGK